MKKIFAILMVALIAGAIAFATVTPDARGTTPTDAQIQITAQIVPVFPQFTLSTTGTNVAIETAAEGATETAALTADAAALLGTGTNVTVGFAIKQSTNAKVKNAYTLTVTATPLALVEFIDADGSVIATAPTADEIALNTFALATGSATPTIGSLHATVTKGAAGHQVDTGVFTSSGNVLTATYNGTVTTTDLSDTTLGTFSVTYEGNAELAAGNYLSTVQLEVAAL